MHKVLIGSSTFMQVLRQRLDSGLELPLPDALLINGLPNGATFTGESGD